MLSCFDNTYKTGFETAPVPQYLWFTIINSRIEFPLEKTANTDYSTIDRVPFAFKQEKFISVPQIDTVGTEFVKKMLPFKYTVRLLDYLSNRAGMKSSDQETNSTSVSFSVDLMKLVQKETAGELSVEYQKQLQSVISYYLGNQARKYELVNEEYNVDTEYQEMIAKMFYEEPTQPGSKPATKDFGTSLAQSFISNFNRLIKEKIENHFEEVKKMENNK